MKYTGVLLLICCIFLLHILAYVGIFLNVFHHFAVSEKGTLQTPIEVGSIKSQPVSRLIFFVLDAFRTSFLFSHSHCLTNIRKHASLIFNVRTFTPTVTSPRLKTLTTGTVPEFADVIFNLDSSKVQVDSLLNRWKHLNMSMVFYGDDTWTKLYPSEMFTRFKEVSSFYAVDYTEVDNAVTVPLMKELNNSDWNVMILHYLGLDHIGHSRGPDGELVCQKLLEMDQIFDAIYREVIERHEDSMLVILGDHGMSNEGSHGGSTDDELYTPAIFVSKKLPVHQLKDKASLVEISQVDIATSLALVTGSAIPFSSLGVIPRPLLQVFNSAIQITDAVRQNYEHLLNLCRDCGPYDILESTAESEQVDFFYKEMPRFQSVLLGRHSSVNRLHLAAILVMFLVSTIPLMFIISGQISADNAESKAILSSSSSALPALAITAFLNAIFVFSFDVSSGFVMLIVNSLTFIWPIVVPIYLILASRSSVYSGVVHYLSTIMPLLAFNAAVLFSSSFVEEEHFFWYLACQVIIFSHFYLTARRSLEKTSSAEERINFSSLLPFAVFSISSRCCKAFIYPGVKWAEDGLDYARTFRIDFQHLFAPIFVLLTIMAFLIVLWNLRLFGSSWRRVFLIVMFSLNAALIFWFKTIRGDFKWDTIELDIKNDASAATPYAQASFVTFLVASLCIFSTKAARANCFRLFLPFWFQMGCLLLRSHLIVPLFFLLLISCSMVSILTKIEQNSTLSSLISKHMLVVAAARMAFSALDNSNRLATLDVGAAYTGLSSHNIILSGCLLALATSTGPLFVFFAVAACSPKPRTMHRWLLVTYQCIVFCLCASCVTLQANHLFVWSVFAPKLLYEVFWTVLIFLVSFLLGF